MSEVDGLEDTDLGRRFLTPYLIAALLVFAAGFVISTERTSASWSNGRITEWHYRDNAALAAGFGVLLLGGLALATAHVVRRADRRKHMIASVAVIALGGIHVARGLGVFVDPPRPPSAASRGAPATLPELPEPPADARVVPIDELEDACDLAFAECPAYRAALETACEQGHLEHCGPLSAVLVDGLGGPADPIAGRSAAVKGCDGGHDLACANLSYFAAHGIGGLENEAVALDSARKACEANLALGCKNLAAIIADKLVTPPPEVARELLDLACRHHARRGCETLADDLLDHEDDLTQDQYATLRASMLRLCQIGNEIGCDHLSRLASRGLGGPRDPRLAGRARARACGLGEKESCRKREAPAPRRAHTTWVEAADGGDHLDRLESLERALSRCGDGLDEPVTIDGTLDLSASGEHGFHIDGRRDVIECVVKHSPYRTMDPAPPGTPTSIKLALTFTP